MSFRILLRRLLRRNQGQDLIEYAFVAAFIALMAIAGASSLGVSLNDWFDALTATVGGNEKKSNCSGQGMISSGGKCHGG